MKLVFVNDTNIKRFVPDCPDEFFRLPYAAAKSDFVRAGVLYHQGGVYMDTDFLLLRPMDEYLKKLENFDIVAYTNHDEQDSSCDGKQFSSNWLAARRGNPFHRTWWENMKVKLTRMCGEGEFKLEKVCCHEAFAKEPERRPCHIPWAALEHLKLPYRDLDGLGPAKLDPTQGRSKGKMKREQSASAQQVEALRAAVAKGNLPAKPLPPEVRLFCLNGDKGLAPHLNGEVYWQPWSADTQATGDVVGASQRDFDMRFRCREEGLEGDLVCAKSNGGNHGSKTPRVIHKFFQRVSYHLFFSTRKVKVTSKKQLIQGPWLLSELYRRSLGVEATRSLSAPKSSR